VKKLNNILRCPATGVKLYKKYDPWSSQDKKQNYPILNSIPRFVSTSNYAVNFGMQWNLFSKTQLDRHSGHPISANRFWKSTGWSPKEMRDKWVLDVGCGSGRFAEIALSTGAHVVALDYSSAVDACWANLKHHSNLHVVQGDIYALPFVPGSFDFVYSLGMLQHTPDVARAFAALPPMLAPNGQICVDCYPKSLTKLINPKYYLRPFTRSMDKVLLLNMVKSCVSALMPISRAAGCVPLIGKLLKRLVPIANYEGLLPLTLAQVQEWAVLDTFDWLSPAYDNPQTASTLRKWFEHARLADVVVFKKGSLVARGKNTAIRF